MLLSKVENKVHLVMWYSHHAHARAASAIYFKRMQQIPLVSCLVLSSFGFSVCQRPVASECPALTTCAERHWKYAIISLRILIPSW